MEVRDEMHNAAGLGEDGRGSGDILLPLLHCLPPHVAPLLSPFSHIGAWHHSGSEAAWSPQPPVTGACSASVAAPANFASAAAVA